MGLPWLQCEGNAWSSDLSVCPESVASLAGPSEVRSASVASTAGPPAFVTMVRLAPRGRGCMSRTSTISNSSAIVRTRSTPARSKAASITASEPVSLRGAGRHQVANALAAAAAALVLGVPAATVAAALSVAVAQSAWRMQLMPRTDGVLVINDA